MHVRARYFSTGFLLLVHLAPRAKKTFSNHRGFFGSIVLALPVTFYCMVRRRRATRASFCSMSPKRNILRHPLLTAVIGTQIGEVGAKSPMLFCPERSGIISYKFRRNGNSCRRNWRTHEGNESRHFRSLFRFRSFKLAQFLKRSDQTAYFSNNPKQIFD